MSRYGVLIGKYAFQKKKRWEAPPLSAALASMGRNSNASRSAGASYLFRSLLGHGLVESADWQLKPHCRPSEVANGPFRGCDEPHAAQPAFSRGSRR